ncbi:hypothetical protein CRUP_017848 [Coryphaenoides rupestris]|nr:hypothetical protein CRUP_017848 [Coryphaenoides rupestris]
MSDEEFNKFNEWSDYKSSDDEDEEGEAKTIRNPDVLEPKIEYSADGTAVNTAQKVYSISAVTKWCARLRAAVVWLKRLQRLTDDDFRKAEEFVAVMRLLYTSTLAISREKSPTCGQILPILDNAEITGALEEMYGDMDAVEFYPGLLLERTRPGAMFGESMVEMGAPFSLKGLLGNPICSPEYWKPSTFGGPADFDIVNGATLERLVCLNARTCPYVSFRIPQGQQQQGTTGIHRPEL